MIHRCLVETARGPNVFLASMVESMLANFDKYWSEYNLYLSCAAILDPRFKIKMVEYCLDKLFGGDEAAMRVENVLSTLKSLYNEYKSQSFASPVVAPPPSSGFDLHEFFDDYHSYTLRNTRVQTGKSQLDLYLDEPPLDMNIELDVLEFWHQNVVRYPDLSLMARDLLTIPVSSVASESSFSLGGKILSPNRSSLKSKTVQALISIQDWHHDVYKTPFNIERNCRSCDEAFENEGEDENDEEVDTSLY